MKFHVRVLRRAECEVDEIVDFIARVRNSPQGARNWYQAYESALARLAESADSMPLAPENEFVDHTVRQTLFKTAHGKMYRGLFTIVGNEVRLLHVRGPGQDLVHPDDLGTQ